MTNFNLAEYVVSRTPDSLERPFAICKVCGKNGLRPPCLAHSSAFEKKVELKVKALPWQKRNQLVSTSMHWDAEGNAYFRGDYYTNECLKYMIVEAPWGATSDTFLLSVSGLLGDALETLVPKMKTTGSPSVDEVKKE